MPGIEEQLIGGWTLISMAAVEQDGARSEPLGPDPMGSILYTANHRMSATLGRRELPRIPFDADAPCEDLRALLAGFISYVGEWELDEERGAVVHKVEYSSHSALTGTAQPRYYTFEDDLLILRSDPNEPGGASGEIVWRRA